ncbi:hypothetical protein LSUB1_G007658 [Lachnellula subtilissima]|uniref:Uncharacterized protein n=1 Tax=Lachnellula subtilissima TaxID=602034 RepID=A0A8H8RCK3_9HELO|nr:hypothetical protein LSUB1_G007658 [Lachnellula subtilissima]
MGGLVAADTLFSVLSNRPTCISPDPSTPRLMFPLVQGLISFDTPYNGLARSMFAYGAFSQYQNISGVWNIVSTLSGGIGMGSVASAASSSTAAGARSAQIASATAAGSQVVASQAGWKRWQALASRTGTAGAIIAGGVTAYMHREQIGQSLRKLNRANISSSLSRDNLSQGLSYVSRESIGEGFTWMASHLKFVGALMKQEQMTTRLERLSALKGVGVANLYTSLGENGYWSGGYFVPKRTFCAVPAEGEGEGGDKRRLFVEVPNTKAANEIEAHCSMFRPEKNSAYEDLLTKTGELVRKWVGNDPRKMVDDYRPDERQRAMSITESEILDDDGKMKQEEPASEPADTAAENDSQKVVSEDDKQLQAILACQDLPQPEDGGISDEDLKQALGVPLPVEEPLDQATEVPLPVDDSGLKEKEKGKSWVPGMPGMPGMPTIPSMPNMPAMPAYLKRK